MSRMMRNIVGEFNKFIDFLIFGSRKWPPPESLCLLTATSSTFENAVEKSQSSSQNGSLSELFGIEWGILWGVPVSKTTRQRKVTRRFSKWRVYYPKKNLIACQQCGSWHEVHSICGECYKKVREETQAIKKRLLAYDPYKGDLPDKDAVVLYDGEREKFGEQAMKDGTWQGRLIIEMEKPRPSWFSADLKKKWQTALPFSYKKPEE